MISRFLAYALMRTSIGIIVVILVKISPVLNSSFTRYSGTGFFRNVKHLDMEQGRNISNPRAETLNGF
jgi:hypothetical protein